MDGRSTGRPGASGDRTGKSGGPAGQSRLLPPRPCRLPGADVVVRRLTFWLDDIPVALHDGYFPMSLVAGTTIERPRKIRGGAHAIIEDPAGPIRRHIARSVDEISGRMPTPDEVRQLRLPPGVHVFRILRTVYDSEGHPVEVQDSVAAGDRHGFCYEVDMR